MHRFSFNYKGHNYELRLCVTDWRLFKDGYRMSYHWQHCINAKAAIKRMYGVSL